MKFHRSSFLSGAMALVIAVIAFNVNAYAQFSVTITGTLASPSPTPLPASLAAPTGQFAINATVTNVPNTLVKVVFYRNDVPLQTSAGSNLTPSINEIDLGQDTYTYRARAYDSAGDWVDSNELKLTVITPRVFKMGSGMVSPSPYPYPSPGPTPPITQGPGSDRDHTIDIQKALDYLEYLGGGTLYFPCSGGSTVGGTLESASVYNIRNTINVPSNITLQSESSEQGGGLCQIKWHDVSPSPSTTPTPVPTPTPDDPNPLCRDASEQLRNKAMFKIKNGASHVRFRDMWMWSNSAGCWPRYDWYRIDDENTTAIQMSAQGNEKTPAANVISDVVVENVSISYFTYGIQAIGNQVSDVKLRGVRTWLDYRDIYIDAPLAHDWDVQNLDTLIYNEQGGVQIIRAGAPPSVVPERKNIKFLQLNCAGSKTPNFKPAFCMKVEKHGGLYVKQLHTEGADQAIIVANMTSGTNPSLIVNTDPIIFENSVATGKFYNSSMKLYLIGNSVFAAPRVPAPNLDQGRLEFFDDGRSAAVVDCGDVHYDWTDVNGPPTDWPDLQMLFTHSERNRESFFARYNSKDFLKSHTTCPAGVAGVPDINQVGGDYFNTGVLPSDLSFYNSQVYANRLDAVSCPIPCTDAATKINTWFLNGASTIYVNGIFDINQPINIPSGRQLIGAVNAELKLITPDTSLIRFDVPLPIYNRISGVAVRNLKLSTTQANTTGIAVIGNDCDNDPTTLPVDCNIAGGASQINFNDLTVTGFARGLEIRPLASGKPEPMFDSSSFKNLTFVNNAKATEIASSNLSNVNVMSLKMQTSTAGNVGWHQKYAGVSMQNVACQGKPSAVMEHCLKMDIAALFLTGFKQAKYVENALTFGENDVPYVAQPPLSPRRFANSVLRDNDFGLSAEESSLTDRNRIKLIGKAFITSMNNKYGNFSVVPGIYEGSLSRVTYCGDRYPNNLVYPGLAADHDNHYVGVNTPTRIGCGLRPKPWEPVVNWGGEAKPSPQTGYYDNDKPLVGNFLDAVQEDMVIYREGAQSRFLIRKVGGGYDSTSPLTLDWGMTGDVPLISRFFPGQRSQVVVFRPSSGAWYVMDPYPNPLAPATYGWSWGTAGDIPFVGNFRDESGSVPGDMQESAVYRPSDKTIYIFNPRSGQSHIITRNADYGDRIQVGDFIGAGYDQIAQFKNGTWSIVDARTGLFYTATLGKNGDVPVAGKFLSGGCTQIGVWVPEDEKFIVKDAHSNCGTRKEEIIWGSNNDLSGLPPSTTYPTTYPDDIPLRINTADGTRDRPAAYRPTKGAFPYSLANGQWWIHDPF